METAKHVSPNARPAGGMPQLLHTSDKNTVAQAHGDEEADPRPDHVEAAYAQPGAEPLLVFGLLHSTHMSSSTCGLVSCQRGSWRMHA